MDLLIKFLLGIDEGILHFVSITMKNKFFDVIMPLFTNLSNHGEIWILIAIIFSIYGAIYNKEKLKTGLSVALALLFVAIICELILKPLVGRPRPVNIADYKFLTTIPKTFSFPSAHSAVSFAASGVVFIRKEKFRWGYIILAAIIAFSRMYLHVHYPSDVFVGMLVGLGCAKISTKIFKKFSN